MCRFSFQLTSMRGAATYFAGLLALRSFRPRCNGPRAQLEEAGPTLAAASTSPSVSPQ